MAIMHDLAAAEAVFRQTYREPFKKSQRQKDDEAKETFRRSLLGADWGSRTPLFTLPVIQADLPES